jgi:hypothetical protein
LPKPDGPDSRFVIGVRCCRHFGHPSTSKAPTSGEDADLKSGMTHRPDRAVLPDLPEHHGVEDLLEQWRFRHPAPWSKLVDPQHFAGKGERTTA